MQEAKRRNKIGGGLYFYRMQNGVRDLLVKGHYLNDIDEAHIFPTKSRPIDAIYPKLDPEICRTCTARIFKQCNIALPNGEPRT